MSFCDFLELKMLDHAFGGPDYARPAILYVGISTTTPADDGTGITEPTTGSYARVPVTNDATNFPAAAAGAKHNGVAINFPTATADWSAGVNMTHFFVSDAAVGGVIQGVGPLNSPQPVLSTQTLSFGVGELLITLD